MNQLPEVFNEGEGVTRKWGGNVDIQGNEWSDGRALGGAGFNKGVCGGNGMEAEVMSEEHVSYHPSCGGQGESS